MFALVIFRLSLLVVFHCFVVSLVYELATSIYDVPLDGFGLYSRMCVCVCLGFELGNEKKKNLNCNGDSLLFCVVVVVVVFGCYLG